MIQRFKIYIYIYIYILIEEFLTQNLKAIIGYTTKGVQSHFKKIIVYNVALLTYNTKVKP